MSQFLTLPEILAIHEDQIDTYGGSYGLRDSGLLESAIYRPQTGYYADVVEEAPALWESLAQNHPFVDGNKRTAFAPTYTFLEIDGVHLTATAEDVYEFILSLYEVGMFRFENLAPWIRANAEHRARPTFTL
jgi:death-on-curing protein